MTDYYRIPVHGLSPHVVNAVVEIPKDTNAKYEYDNELHVFRLDRCLLSAMRYPGNYGFIPNTLAGDGDALDMIIHNTTPLCRGTLVECKVLGCLDMDDAGEKDYKVVAVPLSSRQQYTELTDIDPNWLLVAENFFSHYKDLDNKHVDINGWLTREQTYKIINDSRISTDSA